MPEKNVSTSLCDESDLAFYHADWSGYELGILVCVRITRQVDKRINIPGMRPYRPILLMSSRGMN